MRRLGLKRIIILYAVVMIGLSVLVLLAPKELLDDFDRRIDARRTQTALTASAASSATPAWTRVAPMSRATVTPLPSKTLTAKSTVPARTCAEVDCSLAGYVLAGDTIQTDGIVVGDEVDGSRLWYRVKVFGNYAFINSASVVEGSLLTPQAFITPTFP